MAYAQSALMHPIISVGTSLNRHCTMGVGDASRAESLSNQGMFSNLLHLTAVFKAECSLLYASPLYASNSARPFAG